MTLLRRHVIWSVAFAVAIAAPLMLPRAPARAQLLPDPVPTYRPSPIPCTSSHCRKDHSIVFDVDYTHYAADRDHNASTLTADIQAQIDTVLARQHLIAADGTPRRLIWTTVDGNTHECHSPDDAGILEIEDAEILESRRQYVFIGQQREEVRLAFRILGCAGDERLRFPEHGTASLVVQPTYLSVYGTVGLISLLRSNSNNNGSSTAAVLAAVSANSSLEPDIGAHSSSNLSALARHRLIYGRPSTKEAMKNPPPDALASVLSHCRFDGARPTLVCDPQPLEGVPTAEP